jgi:hypothetical protein
MVYDCDVNLLGQNIRIAKENTWGLLVVSKETGLEVNVHVL